MRAQVQENGGYGWVVVMATCLTTCIEFGTFKSFGVLLPHIQYGLDCSVAVVGTMVAMPHTICYLLVPVSGKAATRYGCQVFVMIGGLLNLIGLLLCAIASSVVTFSFGTTLLGVGFSLSYVSFVITVMTYFPTRFALANSVLVTGAAFGMMILPPVTEMMISMYGWRGTLAMLAAINFNVTAFGALVKQKSSTYKRVSSNEDQVIVLNQCTPARNPSQLNSMYNYICSLFKELLENLSLDIFYLAPKYSLYLLIWFLVGIIYTSWLIFLVPHAISRGITSQSASFLATAGGVGTLITRALHGQVIDRGFISPVYLCIVLGLADAVAFFLDFFSHDNYISLAALAAVNGATLGTISILILPVAQEVLGPDLHLKGYLISMPCFGIGEVVGGFLTGVFSNISGNYDEVFIGLGFLSSLTVLVMIVDRFTARLST